MSGRSSLHRLGDQELLWAGLAIFALLALTSWARPLMLPDEGRYAGVAWEMVRSGNWSTPTLNGLPFFHKPPLFYWISAAAMSVLGVNEWTARCASMVGAWIGIFGIYAFSRRWSSTRQARLVATVLLVQPLFYVGAQFANLDMLVAGCITATVLLAAHAALCEEASIPYRRALIAAYVFAACSVLAKGLIGMVLPGMIVVAWLVLRGRARGLLNLMSLPGLLAFLVTAAPWFVAMQNLFPEFLDYFFMEQHFRRFAGSGFNNVQAWWFYPALLLLSHIFWLPWMVRLFAPSTWATLRQDPVRILMGVWLLVVVVFFSIPRSKLLGYILPAVVPLAYLLCDSFATSEATGKVLRRWWYGAAMVAAAVTIATIAGLSFHPIKSTRELALALRAGHAPGEPVIMLENYFYDVPLYAGLIQPTLIVDSWNDPKLAQTDNWRKEIADAARFAPATAQGVLLAADQLPAALCAAPVSWVVGPDAKAAKFPFLSVAQTVYHRGAANLWRLERAQTIKAGRLDCAETPSAG